MIRRTLLALALLAVAPACQAPQVRRTFPVVVAPSSPQLRTDSGWDVTVSQAQVALAALRFFSGPVPVAHRFEPWTWLYGTAWAHPGHSVAGEALGEVTDAVSVDVLAAEQPWSTARALTGSYGSARLELGAAGVVVAGSAERGGQRVHFELRGGEALVVDALRFERELGTEAGAVELRVELATWLSRVDFSAAGQPDAAGVLHPTVGSAAFNGFARGLADASAYRLTWRQP